MPPGGCGSSKPSTYTCVLTVEMLQLVRIGCKEVNQSFAQNIASSQSIGNIPVTKLIVRISPLPPRLYRSSSIKEAPVEVWVWFSLQLFNHPHYVNKGVVVTL